MSNNSDLPDNVRKAIEDLLRTLSGMTPEEILNMLSEILGENGITEFTELINQNEDFHIKIHHDNFEIDKFMDDLDELFYHQDFIEDIEPYYEIAYQDEEFGEIIVEMPGLSDNSMIDWYDYEGEIYIHTVDAYENYKIVIPIPHYFLLLEDSIAYRNGLLIIPFRIE